MPDSRRYKLSQANIIHTIFTSSRRVGWMTSHSLLHPASCHCCTFSPGSVKSREEEQRGGEEQRGFRNRTRECLTVWCVTIALVFYSSVLTLAALTMLLGDWRAARSLRIFLRSWLSDGAAGTETINR